MIILSKKRGIPHYFIFVLLIFTLFLYQSLWSQQCEKQTIEERLTCLEAGQKNLEKKIEQLRHDVNACFGEINTDLDQFFDGTDQQNSNKNYGSINQQFKTIHQRMDEIKFWLHAIFITLVVLFSTILAQCLIMLKTKFKPDSSLHSHRNAFS